MFSNFRFSGFLVALLCVFASAHAQTAHLAPAEHAQSVVAFQQELNAEYRNPHESPLPPAERKAFKGLPFFPTDYAFYVEATLERDSTALPFRMKTSTAREPEYRKYGVLHFTLNGQPLQLIVYQSLDLMRKPGYGDYLFVPFTDPTNGHESYGGGRYIDLRIPKSPVLMLDFNRAYNPYCAYSPKYSCPVPPAENRLPVAIRAGVQSDH
ncbi:DUF1684 domain-containing protein [Hymenobacter jejuensis]|uniref:DUF1684 domain-containing protein n=1 Tax=Hymenobacter jejuensis TaxID=2502781 RepID=A0A5B7ZXW5_9BACT|nr:DUF1684 domain-containing protein [Hymenobacter jejuensis]QDA59838.1 DUF1684 domain-containing protein [Hymenobacter jejuensis]